MRTLIFTLGLFAVAFASQAQTASKIMDANITWTQSGSQYNGVLNVYLTDTTGIAGLQVEAGTAADSADLHTAQYTISNGGSFWSTGTVDAAEALIARYALSQCDPPDSAHRSRRRLYSAREGEDARAGHVKFRSRSGARPDSNADVQGERKADYNKCPGLNIHAVALFQG